MKRRKISTSAVSIDTINAYNNRLTIQFKHISCYLLGQKKILMNNNQGKPYLKCLQKKYLHCII